MNHCGTQRLETKRLILRRLTKSDAEAMFRNWASDPEVTRFLTWPAHTDVNVTRYVLGTWLPQYEKQDYYHWVITVQENEEEPIGTIHGLVNDDLEESVERLHRLLSAQHMQTNLQIDLIENMQKELAEREETKL